MNDPNKSAGVDYEKIDPFKLLAQTLGAETAQNIIWSGIEPDESFRGESCYPLRIKGGWFCDLIETLGTKEHLAGMYYELTGNPSGFYRAAICAIAMIVNDMLTAGIPPLTIQMHIAAGSSEWFKNIEISGQILKGWQHGCNLSRAIWTGGESPALVGTVVPGRAVVCGSASGIIYDPLSPYIDKIELGHRIIGISSSGVHANGISFIRGLVTGLGKGQEAIELCDEALVPTHIYADLIHAMNKEHIVPSYALNGTGHGILKVMRSKRQFTYRIHKLLPVHNVFNLIQNYGNVVRRQMFTNYNMGIGFVFIADPDNASRIVRAANQLEYTALDMGVVEESTNGEKSVILEPEDLVFTGAELNLRH